jgi:hypothetical protein
MDQKRQAVADTRAAALADIDLEEYIYECLPDVDDERLVPRVHAIHVKGIEETASLTWGDSGRIGEKFQDEEVTGIMEMCPPIGMAKKKHFGAVSFVPMEHWQAWHELYREAEVPQQNNSTVHLTQVAPFIMEVTAATYEHTGRSDSLMVRWYSKLGKYIVRCVVHLDPHRDASSIERELLATAGQYVRDKVRRFEPNIGGNWSLLTWSTGGGPSSLHAAVYWPYPDEDYMTWQSVIDYVYREIHKEKLNERE